MSAQPPGRWSPGQVALVAAAVMLAVVVTVTLLGQAGLLPEATAAGLAALFLCLCGLLAGLIGSDQRRKERWPGATTAYRVAMWCFFLAALHAAKYHLAATHQAEEERIQKASEAARRALEEQRP